MFLETFSEQSENKKKGDKLFQKYFLCSSSFYPLSMYEVLFRSLKHCQGYFSNKRNTEILILYNNELLSDEYSIYRRDREGGSHGEICIFIRNNVYIYKN